MSNGSFHVPVEKTREKYGIFTLNFLIQNLTNISKMQKKHLNWNQSIITNPEN